MHRPPRPLIVVRPIYEWINQVNQQHQQVTEVLADNDRKRVLAGWLEREFAASELRLAGIEISPSDLDGFISSSELDYTGNRSESTRLVAASVASLGVIESLVAADGPRAALTPGLVRSLHDPLDASLPEFRTAATPAAQSGKPVNRGQIAASIGAICMWATAESFLELHPVEQAAIIHLRLIEVQPFDAANERTALRAASLFTVRAGLPPIIINPSLLKAYREAIEEGFRMNTRPMVELLAQAMVQSLTEMIRMSSH